MSEHSIPKDETIRLLVIEDSAYMLMAIRAMVKLDPAIEIVGEAKDGFQGVEMALALRPDVITMDVNMPGLNGIEATQKIMQKAPTAIIMLSSFTERGLAATGDALAMGAIDYLPKTMSAVDVDLATIAGKVAQKIRFWGRGSGQLREGSFALPPIPRNTDLMVMAGGEGAPLIISHFLADLRTAPCPIIVSLDILTPPETVSYVEHLSRMSSLQIREAANQRALLPGFVYVVPGGRMASVTSRNGAGLSLDLRAASDDLLSSAVAAAAAPQLVVLSGKGRDVGNLPALLATRPTAFWVQQRASCALPDLVDAVTALGMPVIELKPKSGVGFRQPLKANAA